MNKISISSVDIGMVREKIEEITGKEIFYIDYTKNKDVIEKCRLIEKRCKEVGEKYNREGVIDFRYSPFYKNEYDDIERPTWQWRIWEYFREGDDFNLRAGKGKTVLFWKCRRAGYSKVCSEVSKYFSFKERERMIFLGTATEEWTEGVFLDSFEESFPIMLEGPQTRKRELEGMDIKYKDSTIHLYNKNKVRLLSIDVKANKNRGRDDADFFVLDEAAYVTKVDILNNAIGPMLRRKNAVKIYGSTPNGKENWFTRMYELLKDRKDAGVKDNVFSQQYFEEVNLYETGMYSEKVCDMFILDSVITHMTGGEDFESACENTAQEYFCHPISGRLDQEKLFKTFAKSEENRETVVFGGDIDYSKYDIYAGIDYGFMDDPMAVVFVGNLIGTDRLVVLGELREEGLGIDGVTNMIRDYETRIGKECLAYYIDRSAGNQSIGSNRGESNSILKSFQNAGLYCVLPKSMPKLFRYDIVNRMMLPSSDYVHFNDISKKGARLMVHDSCINLIGEMESIQIDYNKRYKSGSAKGEFKPISRQLNTMSGTDVSDALLYVISELSGEITPITFNAEQNSKISRLRSINMYTKLGQ